MQGKPVNAKQAIRSTILIMDAARWDEDIRFLIEKIEAVHPYPYSRISERNFKAAAADLHKDAAGLTDAQVVVGLMQLVASLQDGHTTLRPLDPNGFNRWYPLRFYWFSDGLFITAAGPQHKALIGAQVLNIGEMEAEAAARLAARLQGADNDLGARERIQYLSNAVALHALGITPDADQLVLTARLRDGSVQTFEIPAQQTEFKNDTWMYWGEMYGPPGLEMLASLQYLPSEEFRKNHSFVPLHMRCRLPYFSSNLVETNSAYLQFNFVQNWQDQPFSEFYQRLFAWIDQHPVDRFILDIRYNSGGNGGLLIPFVHQFIKRDAINRPGHLYVLVGRKTFSAGVNLIGHLLTHTQAYYIGEPAGAALNHFGDAVTFRLPNSELELQVSRLYHQMSTSDDRRRYVTIHYPAPFDSTQYFAGRDPALEEAAGPALYSIPQLFWDQGRVAAMQAYQAQINRFAGLEWWSPFTEESLNRMGYRLLEASRVEDALAAFELNTMRFPDSSNAWDSLAEAWKKQGDEARSRAYYQKAEELKGNG